MTWFSVLPIPSIGADVSKNEPANEDSGKHQTFNREDVTDTECLASTENAAWVLIRGGKRRDTTKMPIVSPPPSAYVVRVDSVHGSILVRALEGALRCVLG